MPSPFCSLTSRMVPFAGPPSSIFKLFSRYFWARAVSIIMSSGIPSPVFALTGTIAACLV